MTVAILLLHFFLCVCDIERQKLPIDEVLHAIGDVSDWRSLGKHLGIKSSKLDEIGRCSIEEQKPKMVVAWFESDEDCTWEKLEEVLKKPAVSEIEVAENQGMTLSHSLSFW